jgi:thiol-disulfide isomerase/thioredoxin
VCQGVSQQIVASKEFHMRCSSSLTRRLLAVSTLVLLSGAQSAATAVAQSQPQTTAQYDVPSGDDVEALVTFLTDLLEYTPRDQADAEEYKQRAPEAMTAAAQRIIELEQDTQSEHYKFAEKYLLAVDVMAIDSATPAEKQELLALISENLNDDRMDADDLDIAVAFAEGLEMSGDRAMAAKAYDAFSQILCLNKDPLIAELGQLMKGSARRLNLIGNTLEVTGSTLEGTPFNWSAYQGKVVLVDFWATWCGPCLAELPNVQKLYQAYRARGFEVVGICMDEERERLDEFLKTNPLPWTTLHEADGSTNSTAFHYGITSLPTTILIDQQGRVVSLTARGEQLTKLLAQLLGPM